MVYTTSHLFNLFLKSRENVHFFHVKLAVVCLSECRTSSSDVSWDKQPLSKLLRRFSPGSLREKGKDWSGSWIRAFLDTSFASNLASAWNECNKPEFQLWGGTSKLTSENGTTIMMKQIIWDVGQHLSLISSTDCNGVFKYFNDIK